MKCHNWRKLWAPFLNLYLPRCISIIILRYIWSHLCQLSKTHLAWCSLPTACLRLCAILMLRLTWLVNIHICLVRGQMLCNTALKLIKCHCAFYIELVLHISAWQHNSEYFRQTLFYSVQSEVKNTSHLIQLISNLLNTYVVTQRMFQKSLQYSKCFLWLMPESYL